MWGSFLDRGKELAEKALKAAENLDKQLNESVGIETTAAQHVDSLDHADDALNDVWEEDENIYVDDLADNTFNDELNASAMHVASVIVEESATVVDEDQKGVHDGWGGDADDELMDDVEINDEAPESKNLVQNDWHDKNSQLDVASKPLEENPVDRVDGEDSGPDLVHETLKDPALEDEDRAEHKVEEPVVEESQRDGPSEQLDVCSSVFESCAEQVVLNMLPTNTEGKEVDKVQYTHDMDDESSERESALEGAHVDGPLLPEQKTDIDEEPLDIPERSGAVESADHEQETLAMAIESVSDVPEPPAFAHNLSDGVVPTMEQQTEYTRAMEAKMEDIQQRLAQREEQLFSKTEQMTMMEAMHESEKQELMLKVQNTKEEAKRRIQKAKERVDAIELKLKNVAAIQNSAAEDTGKQAEVITALREEGEKLARKQADMEAAVRSSKGEARELRIQLEETKDQSNKALEKIVLLEVELKSTRDDLTSARQGESQAGKLDSDLRNAREESEKRATTILGLEQEVKELKAAHKELRKELEDTRKGAAVETEQERKKLLVEHNLLVSDLEAKLRTSERDAGVREDALRHEVDELRKRWQDAVRRADSLSVDVQSSTAPLLRQLESTNKQNRARAAAWAELETQLRTELEESVILNEKLSKERSEWSTKLSRLERSTAAYETELKQVKGELHDKSEKVLNLTHQLQEMEVERAKQKGAWAEVERLANEGVSRVRSEMNRTIVDSEERHRTQMESLEARLREEREMRTQLEQQVQGLLDSAGILTPADSVPPPLDMITEVAPKRLLQSQGQAEILAGALGGLSGDDEQTDDDDDDDEDVPTNGTTGSFAALEQLTSRLKASKAELVTLRARLADSENSHKELVQVLAESRNAREKLPLFEARVQELTAENRELAQEVEGLRGDIADVRELYRTQLNMLLEAQAANPRENGMHKDGAGQTGITPQTVDIELMLS